jgi:hypothetical protein
VRPTGELLLALSKEKFVSHCCTSFSAALPLHFSSSRLFGVSWTLSIVCRIEIMFNCLIGYIHVLLQMRLALFDVLCYVLPSATYFIPVEEVVASEM